MIFFSLFTSQIPYIALLGICMVYFVIGLGNHADVREVYSTPVEQVIQHSADQPGISRSIHFYSVSPIVQVEASETPGVMPVFLPTFNKSGNPSIALSNYYFGISRFRRPPPFISFI